MADLSAATQSPSVSSSSSGAEPSAPGGAGSPGACPALGAKSCGSCADSFVSSSSSQPVSLFSTSQEGLSSLCSDEPPSEIRTSSFFSSSEIHNTDLTILHGEQSKVLGSQTILAEEGKGKGCLALLDVKKMEKSPGTSKDGANSPVSIAEGGHCNRPSIPASFPDRPAFLSKEVVQMQEQISEDQESKNPSEIPSRDNKTALDADGKFIALTAQKPTTEQSKAEGICTYSLSPCKVSAGGIIEKDSPESPFEVIIDKAAFDREFKDAYKESANDFSSWAMHTDRESSADISESNDKVFPLRNKEAGRYPTSALLTRQFSHTTAALEEVSRCVSDMHNFTNEILTWDLVPQVKQQSNKSDYITKTTGLDVSDYDAKIPVVNLKTNTHQKISVCSINGSTTITKSTGDWAEASLPQENAVIEKPIPDCLDSTTDINIKGVRDNVQTQDDTLSELPGSPFEKCVSLGCGVTTVKVVLPDGHLEGDMNWQSSVLGEGTEADSSGESDDTVIEDITADISFESNKIQAEKPVSISSAIVKADEREIREILHYNREIKTFENFEELISDSEPKVQPDVLKKSPAGMVACSQACDMNVMSGDVKQSHRMSENIPGKVVTTEDPKLPSAFSNIFNKMELSLNVTGSASLESLHEKSIKDVDDSSPEDLIAALTETREKGIVDKCEGNAFEATSEKTTEFKTALPVKVLLESESGGSEIKDIKSKYSERNKETSGSELLDVFSTQGSSVASLDLEQEWLTIKALKEVSERQVEKSAPAQDQVESPSKEILRQTHTFAPESSQPQRFCGVPEHTDVETGSDLGISKKPTVIKETTSVDFISSLSKTELVDKHVLARLLTDFSVHDLIFWRDVKKTGLVFCTTLIVLLSLAAFSVISVVSYLILALLSVTISFRVYKSVVQAVQKSEEGHPFKAYLDVDITLSSEAFHNYVNAAMVHINRALKLIIRLFLVEDLVDSLKLAVFMWLMTYVGAVFNGITLLILAELLIFSVPIVYEKYKTQIDHYVGIARDQTKSIVEKIQAKLPGIAKKKAE
ncbi:reticulon-3 isoform X3 [Molossus molossus]|uniref:Reticulon n=3 Tax=Laurasiatheria TaxID=314145 RepID=A0A7J8EU66_MOLMO|nr:reticulon-3 isoform X3 [Molossus molossus]KAF6438940.1 reticulon 3 [Molossus molossus]